MLMFGLAASPGVQAAGRSTDDEINGSDQNPSGRRARALHELDQTREIPAASGESENAPGKVPSAAPQQVIPIEETVPVQSCIERTLLHEVLRQQSAEEDEDPDRDG